MAADLRILGGREIFTIGWIGTWPPNPSVDVDSLARDPRDLNPATTFLERSLQAEK